MIRNCLLTAVFAILISSSPLTAFAQDSLNVHCLNQYYHNWTDGVYDVYVDGDYAYLSCGSEGIRILNISDSTRYIEVSHYPIEGAHAIAKSGNFIYVGCFYSVLIIDVSDPLLPAIIHTISLESPVNAIKIFGDYAFGRTDGMTIIDISDPYNAHIVSAVEGAYDIDVRNDTAFVAALFQGFQLWDISDIGTPGYLGGIAGDSMQIAVNIYINGNFAYLGTSGRGISVIDISNLQVVDARNSPSFCFRMQGANNQIYVEYIYYSNIPEFHLETIDISDPINPIPTSGYNPPDSSRPFSFYIYRERAYITWGGLEVLDISNPYYMNDIYTYYRGGEDRGVVVLGEYAYINNSSRLSIVNVFDIQDPRETGSLVLDDPCIDFEVQGNIAYLLSEPQNSLIAVDISIPELPVLVGEYGPLSNHYSLDIYSNFAYISEEHDILILNISDPANITYAGHYNYSNINNLPIYILTVYDHLLVYSRYDDRTINVLDLSDPVQPQLIRTFNLDEYCSDAKIADGKIYFISQSHLWIYDVSTWSQISSTQFDVYNWNFPRQIEISGDYAFVASQYTGLAVIDISNPDQPHLSGFYRNLDGAYGVALSGNTIILAALTNLGFYQFTPEQGIDDSPNPGMPGEFALLLNYPNPFNGATKISYELPFATDVRIDIYDIAGRKIETLVSEFQKAGVHSIIWNAQIASSGIYFYKIDAGNFTQANRMLLLK